MKKDDFPLVLVGGAVALVLFVMLSNSSSSGPSKKAAPPPPPPPPDVPGELTADTQVAVAKLFEQAKSLLGYTLRVRPGTGGYRSCEEQHQLYLIGRTAGDTRPVVTQVDGCRSGHTWGRAVDVDIVAGGSGKNGQGTDEDYRKLGPVGQALGFDWGGAWSFYDPGHFGWYPPMKIAQAINYFCPDASDCAGSLARSRAYSNSGNVA